MEKYKENEKTFVESKQNAQEITRIGISDDQWGGFACNKYPTSLSDFFFKVSSYDVILTAETAIVKLSFSKMQVLETVTAVELTNVKAVFYIELFYDKIPLIKNYFVCKMKDAIYSVSRGVFRFSIGLESDVVSLENDVGGRY